MQDRMNPLIVGAAHGSRKRNCDKPGLQRSQKRGDVVEPLRCQDKGPVTRGRATAELVRNVHRAAIRLRPSKGFGNAGPVLVVIDECECWVIRLQTGTLPEHSL